MKKLITTKNSKGVTLIALVVTIIVLLILAGVAISILTGDNGIINQVKTANNKTNYSNAREELQMLLAELKMGIIANERTATQVRDLDRLKDKKDVEKVEYKTVQKNDETVEYGFVTYKNYIFAIDKDFNIIDELSTEDEKIEDVTLTNNDSILAKVSSITESGIQNIEVNGKLYSADVIYVNKNLELTSDGSIASTIDNLSFENGTYTVGNASTDCATSKEEADMAKNMVILKVEGNLTIDEDVILTACKDPNGYGGPKGMLIYCTGTLTNNGNISMTARGAYAKGERVYLWQNNDGTYELIPEEGGLGGNAVTANSSHNSDGQQGKDGYLRRTGGGGSGAANWGDCSYSDTSGSGAKGTSYSGGSGGGSTSANYYGNISGDNASENGGSGGQGYGIRYSTGWASRTAGGGAGNPGGYAGEDGKGNIVNTKAEDGTGGLLIIFANNIVNNSTGEIESCGSKGSSYGRATGGSSGGGSINIFYLNEITQNGLITADGGEKVGNGSKGGDGTVNVGKIINGDYDKHLLFSKETDLYAIIRDSGEPLNAIGISYTRSGKHEATGYDEVYHYGQASWNGVNTNVFTLTMNYDELTQYIGFFNGINIKLHHEGGTDDWSDTSWMWSEIIVNYKDNTKDTQKTETTSWNHISGSVEPELTINFDKAKEINTIKIIIHGFDADDGSCYGWIKNMDLIR